MELPTSSALTEQTIFGTADAPSPTLAGLVVPSELTAAWCATEAAHTGPTDEMGPLPQEAVDFS